MFGFLNKKSPADQSSATKARKGSNGFYMELDESQKAAQPAAEANNGKPAAATEVVKAAEPVKAAQPAKTEAAPKSTKTKADKAAQPAKVESAPQPEPVKAAAPTATANAKTAQPAVKNFAPDYLLTLRATDGRRRPGANMSSFLEMARQVKTRG